ncbi:hypothetical protein GQ53DRAFT_747374 [Thozetella sp. PMI_491]|nr:hypothetical protein GQ53DRAFT_747374 [Thozetella sp. PMI_491]
MAASAFSPAGSMALVERSSPVVLSHTPPETESTGSCTRSGASSPDLGPTGHFGTDVYHSLRPLFGRTAETYYRVVVREDFSVRDIVKCGLIILGYAMSPELFQSATRLPFRRWAELVEANYAGLDLRMAVLAGVEFLAQLSPPEEWLPPKPLQPPCPRLVPNTITVQHMSFAAAMFANASHITMPTELMLDDDAESAFFSAGAATSKLEESLRRANVRLAPDLVPTVVQRSIPHHPCFDLIPWPSFRSKIISAATADPPLIDEEDLCLDMFGGGLRCWGSSHGSAHGYGQGVPWDARSWEALPWFLEKWKILVGDEDGEVSRNSTWWRAMRDGDGDETDRWEYM